MGQTVSLEITLGTLKVWIWILIRQTIMDELVNKLAGLGVAGLVLVGLVATSSYVGAVAIAVTGCMKYRLIF
jgi:hypothetical protein